MLYFTYDDPYIPTYLNSTMCSTGTNWRITCIYQALPNHTPLERPQLSQNSHIAVEFAIRKSHNTLSSYPTLISRSTSCMRAIAPSCTLLERNIVLPSADQRICHNGLSAPILLKQHKYDTEIISGRRIHDRWYATRLLGQPSCHITPHITLDGFRVTMCCLGAAIYIVGLKNSQSYIAC